MESTHCVFEIEVLKLYMHLESTRAMQCTRQWHTTSIAKRESELFPREGTRGRGPVAVARSVSQGGKVRLRAVLLCFGDPS